MNSMADERVPFFVGHAFSEKKLDDFRSAVNDAAQEFPNFHLKAIYADDVLGTGHIFEKIKILVARSVFCLFDITENDRPNIYFELGFAHGIRKPHFLTCEEGAKIPSDLAGYEFLSYRSYKDLRQKLSSRLPEMIGIAVQAQPKQLIGHVDLLGPLLTRLAQDRAPMEELIAMAQNAGFSKSDLMQSVQHLLHMQIIGTEQEKLFLKPDGKKFAKMFFETYKEKA